MVLNQIQIPEEMVNTTHFTDEDMNCDETIVAQNSHCAPHNLKNFNDGDFTMLWTARPGQREIYRCDGEVIHHHSRVQKICIFFATKKTFSYPFVQVLPIPLS
ncbi:MAG: hypothetical protein Ct9H90mP16_06530 [Candidatus Poseidoniales archaeon]|nr:MAG: hypothetical protein Ct9H90mP16_06530 [Candidatus Poseidoniales archaeon]